MRLLIRFHSLSAELLGEFQVRYKPGLMILDQSWMRYGAGVVNSIVMEKICREVYEIGASRSGIYEGDRWEAILLQGNG